MKLTITRILHKIFFCTNILIILTGRADAQPSFGNFSKNFVAGYTALKIPDLELSYVTGLQHIGNADAVKKQMDFFTSVQNGLSLFSSDKLTSSQKVDYKLIKYE